MANINEIVKNYFASNTQQNPLEQMMDLIHEVLTEQDLDASETQEIDISFPKIRISEDFGKVGTEDRAIIEKFARNIPGDSLEAKIQALNNILTNTKPDATVGELLSTMVMCEILSAIITNFTESAGGFIFEGFLAGLFGGKSVQITSPEDIGADVSGKPITDVILGDRHYSLKLLGQTTGVKGSFRNMVEHLNDFDHIVYLDARRVAKDQGLEFGEFTITLDNFIEVFVDPFVSQVTRKEAEVAENAKDFKRLMNSLIRQKKAIKEIRTSAKIPALGNASVFTFSPVAERELSEVRLNEENFNKVINYLFDLSDKELQEYAPFSIRYAEEKFEGTKAATYFGSLGNVERIKRVITQGDSKEIVAALRETPGYQKQLQFEFTRKQAEDIANFKPIGTLMIGPKYMKSTFANYAVTLREIISPVYEQLQLFTDNINDYFLGATGEGTTQDRKQYALNAIDNANKLEVATTNAVEKIEGK